LLLQEPGAASLLPGMLKNLVAVTAGNIVGGSVLVGLVYYAVYIRGSRPGASARQGEPAPAGTASPAQGSPS
jgi:hypothetical protein